MICVPTIECMLAVISTRMDPPGYYHLQLTRSRTECPSTTESDLGQVYYFQVGLDWMRLVDALYTLCTPLSTNPSRHEETPLRISANNWLFTSLGDLITMHQAANRSWSDKDMRHWLLSFILFYLAVPLADDLRKCQGLPAVTSIFKYGSLLKASCLNTSNCVSRQRLLSAVQPPKTRLSSVSVELKRIPICLVSNINIEATADQRRIPDDPFTTPVIFHVVIASQRHLVSHNY